MPHIHQQAGEEMHITTAVFDEVALPNYALSQLTTLKSQGGGMWHHKGQELINFVIGIATGGLSLCHPIVVAALLAQSRTLWRFSNLMIHQPSMGVAKAKPGSFLPRPSMLG